MIMNSTPSCRAPCIQSSFKTSSAFSKTGAAKSAGSKGEKKGHGGAVQASSLNLRAGPGTGNAVRAVLRRGDRVVVHKEQDGWLEVSASSGGKTVRGFVSKKYIQLD